MNEQKGSGASIWPWIIIGALVMLPDDLGWQWGAAVGVIGGIVGAALGVYGGMRKSGSLQERRLLAFVAAMNLLLVLAFGVCFLLMPGYYRFLAFLPFGIGVFLLVRYANRKNAELRAGAEKSASAQTH